MRSKWDNMDGQRAADWKVLADLQPPPFALDALRRMDARNGHTVLQAIRAGLLVETTAPAPHAIGNLFGFDRSVHAFDAARHDWTWLREPQITGALAHFLAVGPFAGRSERVRAFLGAAFECAGAEDLIERLAAAEIVAADAVAEESRVDLIVHATTADQERLGLVVEAKFGHHLTPRQLPAAVRYAAIKRLNSANSAFLVVIPDRRDVGRRIISRPANRAWSPVSWWALLSAFERRLPVHVDDYAFRALRHTIWHQTYG
jgi:hypothetical protein